MKLRAIYVENIWVPDVQQQVFVKGPELNNISASAIIV